jgi:surface antigen
MSPAFAPAAVDRVAIASITGQVYGEAAKGAVSDAITMELFRKGYRVMERSQMKAILDEQEFQASAITSDQDAARAGRVLNVPVVMLVSIPKYSNEKMELSVRLVEVETGELLWLGSGAGSTGRTGATVVGAAVGAVAGAVIAGGDSDDRTIGAALGGLAGGAAGYALSPEQREQVQKAVQKTFENFPSRNIAQPMPQ